MQIIQHKNFEKTYKKLNIKIQEKVIKTIKIFIKNPFSKTLNNHKLKWDYIWLNSMNVTWDLRIIFRELSNWEYEIIELVKIGTHSKLYK